MSATDQERTAFEATLLPPPDFCLKVDKFQWHVHSNVLAGQSGFFKKALNGSFKESSEKIVTLHDDCPWIVGRMIQWSYFKQYSRLQSESQHKVALIPIMQRGAGSNSPIPEQDVDGQRKIWQIDALLCQLADKYDYASLSEATRNALHTRIIKQETDVRQVVNFLGLTPLQRDACLVKKLVSAAFSPPCKITKVYKEMKELFQGHATIMILVHETIVEEFENHITRCPRIRKPYHALS